MRQGNPAKWYKVLDQIKPGSATEKDTNWLLQKMARTPTTPSPDTDRDEGTNLVASFEEELVLETHAAFTEATVTAHVVNRGIKVKSNPGSDGGKRSGPKSRAEYLSAAIEKWPHLFRRIAEQKGGREVVKFHRRPVDVKRMMAVLQEARPVCVRCLFKCCFWWGNRFRFVTGDESWWVHVVRAPVLFTS